MLLQNTLVKGTIERPNAPILPKSIPNTLTNNNDYISIITFVLNQDKRNRINTNSLLYKLSLKQWFSEIKGTITRQELPSWFCGWPGAPSQFANVNESPYFITPISSQEFQISLEQPQLITTTVNIPEISALSESYIVSLCAEDICLNYGLPGSYGYTLCLGTNIEDQWTVINWNSAFYSVIEAAEVSVNEMAAAAGIEFGETTLEEGEEGGGEEGGGGSNEEYPPITRADILKTMFLFRDHPIDGMENSLQFFANGWSDRNRQNVLNFLIRNGCNCMTFFINNPDAADGQLVTPYANASPNIFGGAFSETKLDMYVNWCKGMKSAGIAPIPMWMCDGPRGNIYLRESSVKEHERNISTIVPLLDDYVRMWITGLEYTEYWSDSYANYLSGVIKMYSQNHRKVGLHAQSSNPLKLSNVDFLAYELSWTPVEGDEHSTGETVNEISSLLNRGKTIYAAEYNVNSSGRQAKMQGRAAVSIGASGAWNGF